MKALLADAHGELLQTVIHAHYGGGEANADSTIGRLINSVILKKHMSLLETGRLKQLMLSYHMWGADVALAIKRRRRVGGFQSWRNFSKCK